MKICSVIGCGRMFQLHHRQNLLKCKYEIDEIFDPRKKLLKKISVKLNIKKSYSNFTKFLENNSSKEFFFFLPRDISYYFLKILKFLILWISINILMIMSYRRSI